MITTANINGSPQENPGTKFGSHFDGDHFYFFESKEEADEYYAAFPSQEQAPVGELINISNVDPMTLTEEQKIKFAELLKPYITQTT